MMLIMPTSFIMLIALVCAKNLEQIAVDRGIVQGLRQAESEPHQSLRLLSGMSSNVRWF